MVRMAGPQQRPQGLVTAATCFLLLVFMLFTIASGADGAASSSCGAATIAKVPVMLSKSNGFTLTSLHNFGCSLHVRTAADDLAYTPASCSYLCSLLSTCQGYAAQRQTNK